MHTAQATLLAVFDTLYLGKQGLFCLLFIIDTKTEREKKRNTCISFLILLMLMGFSKMTRCGRSGSSLMALAWQRDGLFLDYFFSRARSIAARVILYINMLSIFVAILFTRLLTFDCFITHGENQLQKFLLIKLFTYC